MTVDQLRKESKMSAYEYDEALDFFGNEHFAGAGCSLKSWGIWEVRARILMVVPEGSAGRGC